MIRYVVNEDKKTVVAILESVDGNGNVITETDACRKLFRILGHNVSRVNHPYLLMPKKYTAKVTCHGEDEFDAEVGKDLARKKVKDKYYEALDRRITRYYEFLKREQNMIYDYFHREIGDKNAD